MKKVILVDTNPADRMDMRESFRFERYGFEIVGEYTSAQSAIAAVDSDPPDLILSEIDLPDISGLAFTDYVHEKHPNLPVVLVTGERDFELARKAIRVGAFAYVLKPLLETETVDVMDSVILKLDRSSRSEQENYPDDLIGRAMSYIEEHYNTSLPLDEVATALFVNKNYLSDAFSKKSGMTFTTYKNTIRVQHAKHLIQQGNHSMSEIAMVIGFDSSSRFSKVFRQLEGMTPQQYKAISVRKDTHNPFK